MRDTGNPRNNQNINVMNTTATLAPVTVSTSAKERDLFGTELATRQTGGTVTAIVSRTDATKTLGRKITFDALTLAEFKNKITADKSLNAANRKQLRQQFLNSDAIKQRQMLGMAALQASYQPDEFAPAGRVPDSIDLRAGGTLRLVSVEKFIGKVKTETAAQKITRLERELREAKAAKAEAATTEAETVEVESTPVETAQ